MPAPAKVSRRADRVQNAGALMPSSEIVNGRIVRLRSGAWSPAEAEARRVYYRNHGERLACAAAVMHEPTRGER